MRCQSRHKESDPGPASFRVMFRGAGGLGVRIDHGRGSVAARIGWKKTATGAARVPHPFLNMG